MTIDSNIAPEVYQGQFGDFTITTSDRQGVIIYRGALMMAALCFSLGTVAVLSYRDSIANISTLDLVTWLYVGFSVSLGIALATIHIYLGILHRTLQIFWAIGCASALGLASQNHLPLAEIVYRQPITLLGVGFTFAALTGIFFKEAFCFNRFETKLLTVLVPGLLLGHIAKLLPANVEAGLLAAWAGLFFIFAVRKAFQNIPPDIGDKSVFEYLKSKARG
jgi:uncharacterized integral membrane protein